MGTAPPALVKVAKVRVQPELGASSGSDLLLVLVLQSRARMVLPGFSQSSFLSTTFKISKFGVSVVRLLYVSVNLFKQSRLFFSFKTFRESQRIYLIKCGCCFINIREIKLTYLNYSMFSPVVCNNSTVNYFCTRLLNSYLFSLTEVQ